MSQTLKENRKYALLWFLTVVVSVGGSVGIALSSDKVQWPTKHAMPAAAANPNGTQVSEPKLAGSQPEGGQSLAERRGCMVCHKIDTKVVGPAYVEVANKYRGDNEASSKLVEKVMKGGSGVWGQIPMPPQAQLSPEDARQLVAWVLALPGE